MGIEFSNLPYYIDNEIRIGESIGILTYICKKYRPEYLGRDHLEAARNYSIYSILADFKKFYAGKIYRPEPGEDFIADIINQAR